MEGTLSLSGPRGVTAMRRGRGTLLASIFGLALVAPFAGLSIFSLQVLTLVFLNAAAAVGLSPSYGFAGMLNFSQAAFVGIGAYVTAYLVTNLDVPFEFAILAACVLALGGGLLLGAATLRVGGDYFALFSLAFSIVVSQVFVTWTEVTGGANGFLGIPQVTLFGQPIIIGRSAYYATLALLAVAAVFVERFARTYAGRSLHCVRLDPVAAAAAGIKVFNTRLLALGISAVVAGAVGAMQVATVGFIAPGDFSLLVSLDILLWVIIGGGASTVGIILSAGALTFVAEEFRGLSDYSVGITGILVLVAILARGGVVGSAFGSLLLRVRTR